MRWRKYKSNEMRYVRRFLFFPKKLFIYEVEETRWLESARIIQRYSLYKKRWIDWRWA